MAVAGAVSGAYPRGLAEVERMGIEVVRKQKCLDWLAEPTST